MHEVRRSAIVPYSPAQMFELVADVEKYPEFVPGCSEGWLTSRSETEIRGGLSVRQGPLRMSMSTRNELDWPHRMTLELVDGPFTDLRGEWRFEPLGESGSRIALTMRFQFENRLMDRLLAGAFETTCNRLVDAFVRRADVVYGRG